MSHYKDDASINDISKRYLKDKKGCSLVAKLCCCTVLLIVLVISILLIVFGIPKIPDYKISSITPVQQDNAFQLQGNFLNLSSELSVALAVQNTNKFSILIEKMKVDIFTNDKQQIASGIQKILLDKEKETIFTIPMKINLNDDLSTQSSSSLNTVIKQCGYLPLFEKIQPQLSLLNSISPNEKSIFNNLSAYFGGKLSTAEQLKLKAQIQMIPESRREQLFGLLTPQQSTKIKSDMNRVQKRQAAQPLTDPLKDIQNHWLQQINDLKPKTKSKLQVILSADITVNLIISYTKHIDSNTSFDCPNTAIDSALNAFVQQIPKKITS